MLETYIVPTVQFEFISEMRVSVIDVGVLQEPVTVAGRCPQQQSMLDAFSMQQTALQCPRAVPRPPVRMMPSSMHAPVRTFIAIA